MGVLQWEDGNGCTYGTTYTLIIPLQKVYYIDRKNDEIQTLEQVEIRPLNIAKTVIDGCRGTNRLVSPSMAVSITVSPLIYNE